MESGKFNEKQDRMKKYMFNKLPGRGLGKSNIYVGIELECRGNAYISALGPLQKTWQWPSGGSSQVMLI